MRSEVCAIQFLCNVHVLFLQYLLSPIESRITNLIEPPCHDSAAQACTEYKTNNSIRFSIDAVAVHGSARLQRTPDLPVWMFCVGFSCNGKASVPAHIFKDVAYLLGTSAKHQVDIF